MYFDEVLKKVSEPLDLAVFFIGFSLGFALDALYLKEGVPSGTTASVVAVGALGVKKAIGVIILDSEYAKKRLANKSNRLRQYFKKNQASSAAFKKASESLNQLENMLGAGLIGVSQFNKLIDEKFQSYIDEELDKSGSFFTDYEQLYLEMHDDFETLHAQLTTLNELSEEEMEKLWKSLDDKYFRPKREREGKILADMNKNKPDVSTLAI